MTGFDELRRAVDQQARQVQALQMTVFSQADPASNEALLGQLAEAEKTLAERKANLREAEAQPADGEQDAPSAKREAARGRFLGADTTGLRVNARLQIDPLPTGAYHLMDPEKEPLLTVEVENVSRAKRRICVKAYIEGLSATAVRTFEIEQRAKAEFNLHPTLLPERVHAVTEVQRATLHVIVEDLGGRSADGRDKFDPSFIECHNTQPITLLARTASFNAVRQPETGELLDLSHYYGAWVTPHASEVQERIRRAVELAPNRQMLGYQGDPDGVDLQVMALYQSLREAEIVYVNSVIDYGAPAGLTTQRTRLPRESLSVRSANCIDGTVLLASLMEGISLNPAIVLVPGHAFVGWEAWHGSGDWRFLETTLIGSAEFDAAHKSGQRQYEQFSKYSRDKIKLHPLQDLRERGIWPME